MNIPEDSLKGKVAVVTGAGSGIGCATAKLFAHAGARVATLGRTQEDVEKTAREIQEAGGESLVLLADISDPDAMEAAFQKLEKTWNQLDIVFANAGINGVWAPLEELSIDDWRHTISINLTGTFITIKKSLPLLKRQGGSIIVTSSVNGTRMFSNTGASAYATSKAGQVALARMLALEFAESGIRVNTVCPGGINTSIEDNMTIRDLADIRPPVEFPEGKIPLTGGRPGTAYQVAETVWFLASDLSAHITGAEVFIDGAQSLFQG